ncbi:MAG: phosphotransferase enzyme family protein [Thermoguttaceae bacterium]
MQLRHNIRSIARNFQIFADFQSAEPCGSGHINDTYAATYRQGGTVIRYIHQRINQGVFKNAVGLMENIQRVTEHLRAKLAGQPDVTRRAITLVPALDGRMFYIDPQGECWRTYVFIEGARTYDSVESTKQAYEAAKAFGQFQGLLADLPSPRLHDTIPDFHNTPKRFAALETAIEADAVQRAKAARAEIDFALNRKPITSRLLDLHAQGLLPERTTHNDTKFNNVLLDNATQEGICIIDLDTVMPGLALYDFGDMVRTTTSPAAEDEQDLSKVSMLFPMFEALVRGYLASAGDTLNKAEKRHLAFSGKLISFEIGIRFLTDFLAGDVYYKVHREGHNLDRCRTQFKLVESIEAQEDAMNRLVESYMGEQS